MTLDRDRLERDAREVLDYIDRPFAQRVARALLAALENPALLIPEGYALVEKPKLLTKGVPGGEY